MIAAVVLAGGLARRMGGGDKPLRTLGGRPMLDRVIERLRPQAGAIAISANGDPARFAGYGLPVLADAGPAGAAGPLAGVLAGMDWAFGAYGRSTRLLSIAGDTPFFPSDLASRLAAIDPDRIAVVASGGHRHPTFALWPVSLGGSLSRFLAAGETFKVTAFIDRHPSAIVEFPALSGSDGAVDPFFNVNTETELAQAERILRSLDG